MKINEVFGYRTFLYRTLRTTFPSFLNWITAVQFRTLYQCTADFTIVAFAFGRARAWWPAFAMLVLYAVIVTIWKERIKNHTINTSIELYLLKKHTHIKVAQDIVFLGTVLKFSLKMLFSYVQLLIFNFLTYALLNLLFDLAKYFLNIKMIWKIFIQI